LPGSPACRHTNKRWVNRKGMAAGGQPFTYQAIAKILNNPTYIGKIRHHDKVYEGQHEAIISMELWEQSRKVLQENGTVRIKRNAKHGSLLGGKCFNPAGEMYGQTYTLRKNVHYRYYLLKSTNHRIKGQDLEALVFDAIRALAVQPKHWQPCWHQHAEHLIEEEAQHRWQVLWQNWPHMPAAPRQEIAKQIIERVIITKHQVTIRLAYDGMSRVIREFASGGGQAAEGAPVPQLISRPEITMRDAHMEIAIAARFQLYGRTHMTLDADGRAMRMFAKTQYDDHLVQILVKAYRWNRLLENGEKTVTQLAEEVKVSRSYISRTVNMLLLAPDIITAILNGKQPPTLRVKDLMQVMPHCWQAQRELLKFV
jgi:site-specific DNA recombinase